MIGKYVKIKSTVKTTAGIGNGNFQYEQYSTTKDLAHIVTENKNICNIEGGQNTDSYDIVAKYANDTYTIKFSRFKDNNVSNTMEAFKILTDAMQSKDLNAIGDANLPKIFDSNGDEIASFESRNEGNGPSGFTYLHGSIHGREFNLYEVGHHGQHVTNYMYDNNNNIVAAIVNDSKLGFDWNFTIYAEEGVWFRIAQIMTLVLQYYVEKRLREGNPVGNVVTIQKGLLEKENKEFIQKIINNTSPEFLPENMEIMKQYKEEKKEAEKEPGILGLKVFAIGMPICIALVIVIILIVSAAKNKDTKPVSNDNRNVVTTTNTSESKPKNTIQNTVQNTLTNVIANTTNTNTTSSLYAPNTTSNTISNTIVNNTNTITNTTSNTTTTNTNSSVYDSRILGNWTSEDKTITMKFENNSGDFMATCIQKSGSTYSASAKMDASKIEIYGHYTYTYKFVGDKLELTNTTNNMKLVFTK